jgi:lysophospholipase L1-like esterase
MTRTVLIAAWGAFTVVNLVFCCSHSALAESKGDSPASPPAQSSKIIIACVGDSITNGAGTEASVGSSNAYPAQLQRMLGDQYEVFNLGVGGTTLLNDADSPYQRRPEFRQAKELAPNIVVIMLGTNDTKPQNWQKSANFSADYEDMIRQFAELPQKPQLYLCHPCFVPGEGNFGINEPSIEAEIPAIDEVAKKHGIPIIDVWSATKGQDVLFPDRVHPNNDGAALIAKAVFKAIAGKDYIGPSTIVSTSQVNTSK